MSLFVKVENEEVTQVWDTQPPAGESGWKSAVEVKPAITANRQSYDGHTFDVSVDPVQIVYAVKDITVDDRKGGLIGAAKGTYQQVANEQTRIEAEDASGDTAAVSAAKDAKDASISAINACTTHKQLDALNAA
tara:strand:- start:484 stop:885 length:402 start_codon:yes stop_codon:yes gene_type:complete